MGNIYIAVGANMSNPKQTLLALPKRLERAGVHTVKASSLWRNPAWPPSRNDPDYLNGVLSVSYDGNSDDLLALLLSLEAKSGRVRGEKNAPRPLDLDIIDYKGQISTKTKLTLPHPRLHSRAFVVLPLAEIAPQWHHPVSGLAAIALLARLPLADMEAMQYEGQILV